MFGQNYDQFQVEDENKCVSYGTEYVGTWWCLFMQVHIQLHKSENKKRTQLKCMSRFR